MVDSELESVDGEGGGREMRGNFYYPTSSPLLSFNWRSPPWYEFFSPQRSTAVKIKDVSSNFHQEKYLTLARQNYAFFANYPHPFSV